MKRRDFVGGAIAAVSILLPRSLRAREEAKEQPTPNLPKWVYTAYGRDDSWVSLSDMDWNELADSFELMHHHFKPTLNCCYCKKEFDAYGKFWSPEGTHVFLHPNPQDRTIEEVCRRIFGREDIRPTTHPLVHQLWHEYYDCHGMWGVGRIETVTDRRIEC